MTSEKPSAHPQGPPSVKIMFGASTTDLKWRNSSYENYFFLVNPILRNSFEMVKWRNGFLVNRETFYLFLPILAKLINLYDLILGDNKRV